MSTDFLSGNKDLIDTAIEHFKNIYSLSGTDIYRDKEIHKDIPWRPSFYFKQKYSIVAFEVSNETLPRIFYMSHANILSVHIPITVISICAVENFKSSDLKALQKFGFGLFTIDDNVVFKVQEGIPLFQHIPEHEFLDEYKSLTPKIKRRLREAYDLYITKPQSGLSEITALVEEIINDVIVQMINKTWIVNNVKNKTLSDKLNTMMTTPQCKDARASIGGLISYVSKYRNMSHHAPKSQKQLYEKIHNSQHGFREGIKQLTHFKEQMKHLNIQLKV